MLLGPGTLRRPDRGSTMQQTMSTVPDYVAVNWSRHAGATLVECLQSLLGHVLPHGRSALQQVLCICTRTWKEGIDMERLPARTSLQAYFQRVLHLPHVHLLVKQGDAVQPE